MMNYEEIKGNIKVRMLNAGREVKGIIRPADDYGFEGLILTPIIEVGETEEGFATIPITEEVIELLGVTEDEIYAKGIENIKYTIKTLKEVMIGMMFPDGLPEEMEDDLFPDMSIYVVSNEENFYGAAAAIAATSELIKKFPEGYIVLPSSIHEVIVVPKGIGDTEYLNDMVKEINAGVVSEKDRLSDDIYEFTE